MNLTVFTMKPATLICFFVGDPEIFIFLQRLCSRRKNSPEAYITPILRRPELHLTSLIFLALLISNKSTSLIVCDFSGMSTDVTPSLHLYLRDRKTFMQLGSPDMSTPRRARMNLRYGQETVTACKKKIDTLQQQVRRLSKKVKTYKDLICHLKENNLISMNAADILSVC